MRADKKTKRAGVGLASLLVVGGAVVLSSAAPAVGADTVSQNVGLLRIHMSNSGSTITYSGPLSVPATQSVSIDSKCSATTGSTLVQFTPTGGTGLGIVSNGMGVKTKNTCATSQGQLTGSQTLTIALGSAFPSDVRVDTAELDIEGKHGAKLGVQRDGATSVTAIALNTASDNGPDSGVGDNSRVILTDDFTSLTLSAVGGELSLEGGGDGSYSAYSSAGLVGPIGASIGSADTVFKLIRPFDHAVPCQGTVNATLIGGSASDATLFRDDNLTAGPCEDIPVSLHVLNTGVSLLKTTTGLATGATQSVSARLTIEWKPVGPPVAVPLPARQIDFDGDGTTYGFENVKWCSGTDPVTGQAIHPTDARFAGGKLPWCLVSSNDVLQSNGSVKQTQVYDGSGDPFWR